MSHSSPDPDWSLHCALRQAQGERGAVDPDWDRHCALRQAQGERMSHDPDWSEHCGDLWRQAVLSAAGRDICDIVGPSPRRPREWAAMMRRLGARSLHDVVCAVHGPAVPVRSARRGDIVRMGWAMGVCLGEHCQFFGGVMVPLGEVDAAWPVTAWLGSREMKG